LVKFSLLTLQGLGLPLFTVIVQGETPNSRLQNLSERNQKHHSIVGLRSKVFRYLEPFRRESRMPQTDRRTDRLAWPTDRMTN